MHIETTSKIIIHYTPYRQPPAIEEEINKEVQEMLIAGLIRKESAGTWCSHTTSKKKAKED